MKKRVGRLVNWFTTLNNVDVVGENSVHRFTLSARLGLWPAIAISSFAFGHLTEYDVVSTAILSLDLSLVASIAFLFNDARDAEIDKINNVHRWSIRSEFDLHLFVRVTVACLAIIATSFIWLSKVASFGVLLSLIIGIVYSLICKRVFLLGNVVAAALSISPGLIMLFDTVLRYPKARGTGLAMPATSFLLVAFLLLLSREVRFDQFDVAGDKAGGRHTVPMVISGRLLNLAHATVALASLCLLSYILISNGKYSLLLNSLFALICVTGTAYLMTVAYKSNTKEHFYKKTRLVMLVIPISILVSF
jgi:4-hydroxybenzoate polyprenyltransferase